jgi:phage shock protein A
MSLLNRASKLLKANINHLLDSAEDPEVMIKQLIHEMDEAVSALRRETVNSVARQKQLEKKVRAAEDLGAELEKKAALALDHDNETLARKILADRAGVLSRRDSLHDELEGATALASQIKRDLVRMQEQASLARRKKDELVRRKRAAEAQFKTQEAARRSAEAISDAAGRVGDMADGQSAFDGYADSIHEMEARAEAARELSDDPDDSERELRKLEEEEEVEKELARLKESRVASS